MGIFRSAIIWEGLFKHCLVYDDAYSKRHNSNLVPWCFKKVSLNYWYKYTSPKNWPSSTISYPPNFPSAISKPPNTQTKITQCTKPNGSYRRLNNGSSSQILLISFLIPKPPLSQNLLSPSSYHSEKILIVNINNEIVESLDTSTTPSFRWKKLWLFTYKHHITRSRKPRRGFSGEATIKYSLLWLLMWVTVMEFLI